MWCERFPFSVGVWELMQFFRRVHTCMSWASGGRVRKRGSENGGSRECVCVCARAVDMTSFSLKIFTNVFAPLFEGDTTWGPSSYWVLYLLSCEKMPKGLRSGVTVSEAHHIAALKTWFCFHGCGYLTVNVCQYLPCFILIIFWNIGGFFAFLAF